MLYSEFAAATGCKDNEHNHKVYKDLEILYMNSTLSKADIYEYGMKLVDNSKSEQEIEIEERIKAEIQRYRDEIQELKKDIEWRQEVLAEEPNPAYKSIWRDEIKWRKEQIKRNRQQIKSLRWVIA